MSEWLVWCDGALLRAACRRQRVQRRQQAAAAAAQPPCAPSTTLRHLKHASALPHKKPDAWPSQWLTLCLTLSTPRFRRA